MKAKEGVINLLNKILTADLTAINQYFVHAKMCENWGYERLHHKVRERSIDEMKDADELIGHILYLDGVPNVQRMNPVQIGETVPEQLKLDLKAEQEMLALLSDGVVHCTKVTDFTTRHMFEDMAKDVDAHIDWIETQMETIKQTGFGKLSGRTDQSVTVLASGFPPLAGCYGELMVFPPFQARLTVPMRLRFWPSAVPFESIGRRADFEPVLPRMLLRAIISP